MFAADDGYEDFVADINEPLTFLFLKLKRTIYHVCQMKLTAQYFTLPTLNQLLVTAA